MAEEPRMWEYWRDDNGVRTALEVYYPETVAADPVLGRALGMIQAGEALAEQVMSALSDADAEAFYAAEDKRKPITS